ncbi:hypothetical protein [Agrilactobacillus fermenti]|nr:hypothetical protein [Agrilactobacillus fermenti]
MITSFRATFREKVRRRSFLALCLCLMFSVTLMLPKQAGGNAAIDY